MFIGHFAVGLALKRVEPTTSLGVFTAAVQLLDLLWPCFLLLGWEHVRIEPGNTAFTPLAFDSYPLSHSLVMALVWGALFGWLYLLRTRRPTAAIWIGLAVVSHWVLDWIVHRPDLPIAAGVPTKVGLGLWNSIPATVAVEGSLFALGVWVYVQVTRPRDRMGLFNFWLYIAVLVAIYVGNIVGPPPPNPQAVALIALGLWLFPFWTAWIDRHWTVRRITGPDARSVQ